MLQEGERLIAEIEDFPRQRMHVMVPGERILYFRMGDSGTVGVVSAHDGCMGDRSCESRAGGHWKSGEVICLRMASLVSL